MNSRYRGVRDSEVLLLVLQFKQILKLNFKKVFFRFYFEWPPPEPSFMNRKPTEGLFLWHNVWCCFKHLGLWIYNDISSYIHVQCIAIFSVHTCEFLNSENNVNSTCRAWILLLCTGMSRIPVTKSTEKKNYYNKLLCCEPLTVQL